MMMYRAIRSLPIVVAFCGSVLVIPTSGAEPSSPPPATAKTQQPLPEIPADLVDPAFEGKIDLSAIRQAIGALDAVVLIDQAEKLVLTERSLGRRHRTLSAQSLFGVATRAIAEKHDRAALDRLARTLAGLDITEFDQTLASLRQLLDSPRRISPGPNVPLREVSIEAIVLYNMLAEQVKVAKVVGDRTALGRIRETIQGLDELHVKQQKHLLTLIDDALVSLPSKLPDDAPALARLSAPLYTTLPRRDR